MNGTISLSQIVSWASALVVAAMAWFLKRHFEKFDELDREAVRKKDLKELLEAMKAETDSKHLANLRSMDSIATEVHGTNKRIDEMFTKLLYRSGGR